MKLSELKIIYKLFDNREDIKKVIASIKENYVNLSHIEDGCYFWHDEYAYSEDLWVIDGDGNLLDIDSAFYCMLTGESWHYNDSVTVNVGGHQYSYYHDAVRDDDNYYYYDGEYYDDDALMRYDLVFLVDTNEVRSIDDAWYHESDGCYRSYEEKDEYLRDYHSGGYHRISFGGKKVRYKIGYEIEKEDEDVLESITINDFECETNHCWRKEKDGSLNSSGYELISPTFDFNMTRIFEHIEKNEVLVDHINAKYSQRCGGHIHLSEEGLTGYELFDKIKGYTPLFYALYYGRVDKDYCKGKKNEDLKNDNNKYQAIKIHDNRIEFRIISAVPNLDTLKWRTKLLRTILTYPTDDVVKAYYYVDTKFTGLLKQTYSNDKLTKLKERFVKFTKQFEDVNI